MTEKKSAALRSALNPKTPVIVSCRGKDGRNNALVVVYACNCSYDPPMIMVGVVPSRYSYDIIKETGVFVANLVSDSMREAFDYLGSHSGRDGDKFASLGLKTMEGIKVNAPILLDSPVSIECTWSTRSAPDPTKCSSERSSVSTLTHASSTPRGRSTGRE
jgi:flavin reductase (DIM6/NTAB) family NADH-FMN oxidoreductase RutF